MTTPRQQWEVELKQLERDVAAAQRKLAFAESAQEEDRWLQHLEGNLTTAKDKLQRHLQAVPGKL